MIVTPCLFYSNYLTSKDKNTSQHYRYAPGFKGEHTDFYLKTGHLGYWVPNIQACPVLKKTDIIKVSVGYYSLEPRFMLVCFFRISDLTRSDPSLMWYPKAEDHLGTTSMVTSTSEYSLLLVGVSCLNMILLAYCCERVIAHDVI